MEPRRWWWHFVDNQATAARTRKKWSIENEKTSIACTFLCSHLFLYMDIYYTVCTSGGLNFGRTLRQEYFGGAPIFLRGHGFLFPSTGGPRGAPIAWGTASLASIIIRHWYVQQTSQTHDIQFIIAYTYRCNAKNEMDQYNNNNDVSEWCEMKKWTKW